MPNRKKSTRKKGSVVEKPRIDEQNVEPGMVVEATEGDFGEEDISKPKVKAVVQDDAGTVEKLVVSKGVVFHKTLDIPTDRVQAVVQEGDGSQVKVVCAATEEARATLQ